MVARRLTEGILALGVTLSSVFLFGTTAGAKPSVSEAQLIPAERALFVAQGQAKSVCGMADNGAVASAVFAFQAADTLRSAGMNPSPWSRLPNEQIVFQCFARFSASSPGVFVDLHGHRSSAPTLGVATQCHQSKWEPARRRSLWRHAPPVLLERPTAGPANWGTP